MSYVRRLPTVILLLALCGCLFARPAPESATEQRIDAEEGDIMTVTGVVRLVGAEPFADVVITDDQDVDWYVLPQDLRTLAGLEQQRVRVQGVLTYRRMTLADGRELPQRRELTDLELLEVVK